MRYLSGSEIEELKTANPDFAAFIENFLTVEISEGTEFSSTMYRVTTTGASAYGIGNSLNDAINDFFQEMSW